MEQKRKKEKGKEKEKEKEKYSRKKGKDKVVSNNAKKKKKGSAESSGAESYYIEKESDSGEEEEGHEREESEVSVSNVEKGRKGEKNEKWYLDSGCTAHLTNEKKNILSPRETSVRISGPLSNNKSSKASVKGDVRLKIKDENKKESNNFELKNVICDENLKRNLMSVRKLTKENLSVLFWIY